MMHTYKVLVVDDDPDVCFFMADTLATEGYRVVTASNGREGLMKALKEIPDCIVLDVVLPEMSGFEVCRRLRAKDPHHRHRIVLVSGKNTALDHRWGWKQGADYYLDKPFSDEALLQAVRYVLTPNFRPPVNTQQLRQSY